MSELKKKSVKGIVWALGEQFGLYGMKFILGIILARILTPEDFGLIGMVTVFFAIAQVFLDSGFGMAFIQKKQINEADADTVFYTNMVISIVLYGVLYFSAPYIAKFYNQSELVELTRVMSLVLVINAFNIIQRSQIIREINFKKLTNNTIIATSISGAIGIAAAYNGYGVWSLVIQSLSNKLFIAIGFWFTTKYRPSLRFSWLSFKEMFSFGFWVLSTNILRKIFDNIYLLVIGKFFPVAQLGFYTKAKQFQLMVSNNIGNAIGSVAFPVYSKLQNDKEKLREGMKKFLVHSTFFVIPISLGLLVLSQSFVLLLLKETWLPMVPYLQLLCIAGALFPISIVNIQAITAQGKTRLTFNLDLIKNALRILNILITFRYGVIYIILGEVVFSFIALVLNAWFSEKLVGYGLKKQLLDIWKIFTGGALAVLFVHLSNLVISNPLTSFFVGFFLFSLVYLGFQYFFNKKVFFATFHLFKGLRKL